MKDILMTQWPALWVDRTDITKTKQVTSRSGTLADGKVLVALDTFVLIANNLSYAMTGDSIGYWHFYPAEEGCEIPRFVQPPPLCCS
tara:strand:- start:14495 stop:14755 length:261 start_codon:yes stop_codon:yes gene_type:complete